MLSKSALKRARFARANARLDHHSIAAPTHRVGGRLSPFMGDITSAPEDTGTAFQIELSLPAPDARSIAAFHDLIAVREATRREDIARSKARIAKRNGA